MKRVEVSAMGDGGEPIAPPYPRWVDAAFGGIDEAQVRLVGTSD